MSSNLAQFAPPASDAPIKWALAYAAAGMRIFPVRADKTPLTKHGVKDATTDEAQICAWWTSQPYADIGWAVPAEIVVMDADVGKGANGLKEFAAHEGAHPDDVVTPQASSPRGGRHFVFEANGAVYRNNVRLNGSAIDLRTEGGYVVVPGPGTAAPGSTPRHAARAGAEMASSSAEGKAVRRGAPVRRRDGLRQRRAHERLPRDRGGSERRTGSDAQRGVLQHRRPRRRRRARRRDRDCGARPRPPTSCRPTRNHGATSG